MESQFFPLSTKEAQKAGVLFPSTINRDAGFPTRLRELRDKEHISQQKLADEIGVTKSTIGLYENGDNVPDAKTLYKLAKYYGVSTDYLLGLSDVKTTDTDVKAVCEYTGLIESVINRVHGLNPTERFILNLILGAECLDSLLSGVSVYAFYDQAKVSITDSLFGEVKTSSPIVTDDIIRYIAQRNFDNVLDMVRESMNSARKNRGEPDAET